MPARTRQLLCALLLATLAVTGRAEPEAPTQDPVSRFLEERGLGDVPLWEPSLVRQARHSALELVRSAMEFIGVRYRRGGLSAEEGFDCSGFTRYVYNRSIGLLLPRAADEQAAAPGLIAVEKSELQPGDLVFFNTLRRTFSHVGIYVGDGKFIHAPRTGSKVRVEDMRGDYWVQRYNGARRVPQIGAAAPETATTPAS